MEVKAGDIKPSIVILLIKMAWRVDMSARMCGKLEHGAVCDVAFLDAGDEPDVFAGAVYRIPRREVAGDGVGDVEDSWPRCMVFNLIILSALAHRKGNVELTQ